jgi:hypothetical protein
VADRGGASLTRRALDVTGSILTTLLVFGATPAVLLSVVGDPLGGGMGHQWGQEARLLLAAVALVAWVAWAVCCMQLARAVVEQVRRGQVGSTTGAVLTDRVAARIAAGVLALVAFGAPLSVSAGAGASGPQRTVTIGRDAPTAPPALASAPSAVGVSPAPGLYSYVVRPGDSLWSIAAALLGDGDDWPAIAALNLGRTMGDGLQFVDPNTIHAGWTLLMPDQAVAPVPAVPAVPTVAPVTPDADPGAVGSTHRPASTVPAQTDLARRWLPVASSAGPSRIDDPMTHCRALRG